MRCFVGLIFVLTLALVACSETAGTGGTGGEAGTGGTSGVGGTAGTGGSPIVLCEQTSDRCQNAPIDPHEPCCEQPVPDQENACDGTESTQSPATCTPTGNAVTHRLTVMELEGDCNVGYDLDTCQGRSCVPTGLAPEEGLLGVDNAFAGFVVSAVAVGGDYRGFNQGLSDALCRATDDWSAGTCRGGGNDGNACTRDNPCPGAGARCDFDDDDCLLELMPTEVRLVVDANASEDCANVTVLADDEASAHILNLSDDGCASGTLGTIPITIGGEEGSLENTVVRMTLSPAGFSHGLLGAAMDVDTAAIARGSLGITAAVDWPLLDISASIPPVRDASAACNGLSVTLRIGGIAE